MKSHSKASKIHIPEINDKESIGRGTAALGDAANPVGRFEKMQILTEDFSQLPEGEEAPSPRTEFYKDVSRSIVSMNDSPDIPFGAGVNPYRGCEHGCIYCFARPYHEYLGMSAGLDFETKIYVKHDAAILLREKLMKPSWVPQTITVSAITDCYQPAERKFRITRSIVDVLREFRNPLVMITKNHLVTRDIDLFKEMTEYNCVEINVSITSLEPELTQRMEPRTSRPSFRLKAIEELTKAGIPVGVMVAPIIPGLTDHEMPEILKAAASAGAKWAGYVPVRLPYGVKDLFSAWVEKYFPDRKDKILNRIREIRDGKLNDPNFNTRMRGTGVFAEHLRAMFKLYCAKEGLNQDDFELSTKHFKRPEPHGQFSLFDQFNEEG